MSGRTGARGGRSGAGRPGQRSARAIRGLTRPEGWLVAAVVLAVVVVGAADAASFRIGPRASEVGTGVANSGAFLTHWQAVGASAGTIPGGLRVLSTNPAAPSRLPGASVNYRANRAVVGHAAFLWSFNETAGIGRSLEIEIQLSFHYLVGAVTHKVSSVVYVETQAAAIAGTFAYSVYWDSGATAGVSLVGQVEVSQLCLGVGVCP